MPGGGINSENVAQIVRATQAKEVHSSAGTSNPGLATHGNGSMDNDDADRPSIQSALFEQEVAQLASLLGGVSRDQSVI